MIIYSKLQKTSFTHIHIYIYTISLCFFFVAIQNGDFPSIHNGQSQSRPRLVADVPAICAQTKVQTSEDVFAEVQRPQYRFGATQQDLLGGSSHLVSGL